jgi:hypothetical protein
MGGLGVRVSRCRSRSHLAVLLSTGVAISVIEWLCLELQHREAVTNQWYSALSLHSLSAVVSVM